jgi:hypothetical protein
MQSRKRRKGYAEKVLKAVTILVCCGLACSICANAQTPGQDAVYSNSSGTILGSWAFIDASAFVTNPPPSNRTLCGVLNYILDPSNHVLTAVSVIDARSLNSGNTSMTCATNTTPWYNGTGSVFLAVPSTILLPATTSGAPIGIPKTWILPSNTHLIGAGDGIPSSGVFNPATVIQATSGLTSGQMIQFGTSSVGSVSVCSSVCTGITVENLTLDGNGTNSLNGIVNQYAQDFSYIDHVSLYRVRGTGVLVGTSGSGTANNSGPYTNITFDMGGTPATSSTVCAQITGLSGTRGIQGLNCLSENNDAPAAVLLDASNNIIRDVKIVGFYDGVRVGASSTAQSNVLINVIGDTSKGLIALTPVNAVHIATNASDLSIMGVSNSGLANTYTIEDDVTFSSPLYLADSSVGIYAVGEPSTGVPPARFTTSSSGPTWATGASSPSSSCSVATRGALFSCINSANPTMCGATPKALWACVWTGGASTNVSWVAVQ